MNFQQRLKERQADLDYEAEMARQRSAETAFATEGESLTKQADAHDCDINVIVAKYAQTRDPSVLRARQGSYMDLTDVPDYFRCVQIVQDSYNDFLQLSPEVRERFGNKPENLVAALYDPARRKELQDLGIFEADRPNIPEESKPKETTTDNATT